MQHGTAAWQKAAAQHGAGPDKTNETTSSYQQQSYTKQQQYSQLQQQLIQQQQKQQSESSNQKPLGSMGTLLEMKKPVKSRFSSLPAAASTSNTNTTTQQMLTSSEAGGKGPAGDSMMPANWPTSLKMFVARSFSGCKTDEDRKNISQALEKLINKVAFDDRVTTHKWELEDISASLIPKAKVAVAVPYVEAKPKVLLSPFHVSRPAPTTNFEIRDSDLKAKGKVAQKASYRPTIDTFDNTYGPDTYGASSSAGNATQISYGGYGNGYGNGNGNGKVKQPYSPPFSPSSASATAAVENDKKRKSRWDLDSNSSNGDSMATVFPKSMKQLKNETKHKSQKMLPSDHPASNSKKKESGSRIIEKPPTNAEQAMREKRASRFKESDVEVEAEIMRMPSLQSQSQIFLGSKNTAKKRGSIHNNYHNNDDKHNKNFSTSTSDFDFESLIVIGTCQKLEKDYFRLTSAPIPNTVRPEDILKRSLQLLKEKWNSASVEYVYMCSQFKSMRQDLTVQHIQNGESKSVLLLLVFTDLIP